MNTKITIHQIIKKPLDVVYDAYNNPKHIINWNHASDDWYTPRATNNLYVGGKFSYRMEEKSSQIGFDFEGTYKEVSKTYIAYVMDDDRSVEINFKDLNHSTEVIVTFDAESETSIDLQKSGWQSILDNFKKYTEKL